jgi:hypothetical protein
VTADTLPHGRVEAVNTPPPDPQPTWMLREELRVGTVGGGPGSFGQIKGLVALDDSGFAVVDARAQEVRIFGADGSRSPFPFFSRVSSL